MSKRTNTGHDAPVCDGEWVGNYNTTTYWSPTDITSDTPYKLKPPYYEGGFDFTYKNDFNVW